MHGSVCFSLENVFKAAIYVHLIIGIISTKRGKFGIYVCNYTLCNVRLFVLSI